MPAIISQRRLLSLPLALLAALVVLFEEFVWDHLTRWAARLARLGWAARLEAWILTLNPYATVALFAVPLLVLLPVKLLALYLLARGRVGSGLLVIVAAKVVSTTVSARLFVIAKPKLMTFTAFRWVYGKVLQFKQWAHALLLEQAWLQGLRARLAAFKANLRAAMVGLRQRFTSPDDRPGPPE